MFFFRSLLIYYVVAQGFPSGIWGYSVTHLEKYEHHSRSGISTGWIVSSKNGPAFLLPNRFDSSTLKNQTNLIAVSWTKTVDGKSQLIGISYLIIWFLCMVSYMSVRSCRISEASTVCFPLFRSWGWKRSFPERLCLLFAQGFRLLHQGQSAPLAETGRVDGGNDLTHKNTCNSNKWLIKFVSYDGDQCCICSSDFLSLPLYRSLLLS